MYELYEASFERPVQIQGQNSVANEAVDIDELEHSLLPGVKSAGVYSFKSDDLMNEHVVAAITFDCRTITFYNAVTREVIKTIDWPQTQQLSNCRLLTVDQQTG